MSDDEDLLLLGSQQQENNNQSEQQENDDANDDDNASSSSGGDDDKSSSSASGGDAEDAAEEDLLAQLDDNNNDESQRVAEKNDNGEDDALRSMSKKEAKNSLSKKEYKKWKKLQKKNKKKDKKSKDKKKGKKESSKKKAGKKSSGDDDNDKKSSRQKKTAEPQYFQGEDGVMYEYDNQDAAAAAGVSRMARGSKKQQQGLTAAAKSKKPQIPIESLRDEANLVVMSMTEARRNDEAARKAGLPPLRRLSIKDVVANAARKVILHEHLVNAGLLDEIVYWLADPATKDLAPVDLRLIALHILDNLAFEGLEGGMRVPTTKKSGPKYDPTTGDIMEVDDLGYPGVSAEMLQATKLGWAVNLLRRHPHESAQNRTTATRLLEKFSRVFRGGDDEDRRAARSNGTKVLWSSQSDNTILPPFEVMPSVTQRFIEASTKADPNDPISYMRVRRAYNQPSYVTGLMGDSAARAMAGPRGDVQNAVPVHSTSNRGRKANPVSAASKSNKDKKKAKKKNNKASLDSDDDGSLLETDDDDDDDDGGFIA